MFKCSNKDTGLRDRLRIRGTKKGSEKMTILNGIEICDENVTDHEKDAKIKKLMPGDELLFSMADFFKIFGDSTRIRILYALLESELCVCDIAEVLDMTVSAVSHQLRVLKQARLVSSRRNGKSIIYAPADDHVKEIIAKAYEHLTEEESGKCF